MFSRDSMISIGSRLLWHMYNEPRYRNLPGNGVTRVFSTIAIAASCGVAPTDDTGLSVTEIEFRLLCWELYNSYDPKESFIRESQLLMLARRLTAMDPQSPLEALRNAQASDVYRHHIFSLLTEFQRRPFSGRPSDLVRPFLVYENFRRLFGPERRFESIERSVLGTTLHGLAHLFPIFTHLTNQDPFGPVCPGVINIDPHGTECLGALHEADLATITRSLGQDIETWPRDHSMNVLWLRRLEERPILTWQSEGRMMLAVPSPWHLRTAIARLLLERLPAELKANGIDPYSRRGEAFETYLEGALSFASPQWVRVPRIDDHRSPDFVWIGSAHVIIVEAKNQLTPNSSALRFFPSDGDATDVIAGWERAAEAIVQARDFITRNCDGLHAIKEPRFVLAVAALEPCAAEATGFRRAAKQWGLLRGTKIEALRIVGAAELEQAVLQSTPDSWGAETENEWSSLDLNSPTSFDVSEVDELRCTAAIDDGSRRFFTVGWNSL
jgi:hypothetical protein